ncbi:MAG: hypothetical protein Q4C85_09700 [Actinomyces sp.]|uniref:hypothetical protein n=1 Tax=Actinomyces sp. TaxID=29317 RepID=UPI0026DC1026|nr:hypothetical protein [Actinomyces sp.]MDO4244010.1 hypothetical protein [Actinomyces sp.]
MMGPALCLSLVAVVLYPLTRGYGSIVALALAVFLLLGRQMIERQVVSDVSDLHEATRQYERTRNPEYLDFTELRAAGMLEDNKMLTGATRELLHGKVEWARQEKARNEGRAAQARRRAERRGRDPQQPAGEEGGSGPLTPGAPEVDPVQARAAQAQPAEEP